jgi:hypothetical protein
LDEELRSVFPTGLSRPVYFELIQSIRRMGGLLKARAK